jgi:hypothetical protein
VQPLANEPLVLEGVKPDQQGWLKGDLDEAGRFNGPSIQWFQNPARWDVQWSLGGPDEWQHVQWKDLQEDIARGDLPPAKPVEQATVRNVKAGNESIEFDVDKVGTPVLVKTSYFPNWKADGAEGPWRVAPNLMVVVPTEKHVRMSYGNTPVDYMGYGFTLLGLVALVLLARWGSFRFRPELARTVGAHRSNTPPPPSPDGPGQSGPFSPWAGLRPPPPSVTALGPRDADADVDIGAGGGNGDGNGSGGDGEGDGVANDAERASPDPPPA